jgi:hypothetical protein
MKRLSVVLAAIVVGYALLLWRGSLRVTRVVTPARASIEREPSAAALRAPVAADERAVKSSAAPAAPEQEGPAGLDAVRKILVPPCPDSPPQDQSHCDLSLEFLQRCAYGEGEHELICSCDAGSVAGSDRLWRCHSASEEAEAAAVPICPPAQPPEGSNCNSLTQLCPYDEARTTCACGDDARWSCGPRKSTIH